MTDIRHFFISISEERILKMITKNNDSYYNRHISINGGASWEH